MNKTVNINLAGTFFHIDEDAYSKLSRYLDAIKKSLSDPQGKDEIIRDIEARIAELFSEKIEDHTQVITLAELDQVIAVMGQPEDYRVDEELFEDTPPKDRKTRNQTTHKQLFRDVDNKFISGVAAGLGHYLGIDTVWVRLLWVLLTLLSSGTFILIYILFWIIVPAAETTSDKLKMTGQPVNISNIEKKFKEGYETVADRVKNVDYDKYGREIKKGATGFFETLGNILLALIKIFVKFIGIIIILIAVTTLVSLIIGLVTFGSVSVWDNGVLTDYIGLIDVTNSPLWLVSLLVFFAVGIPFFALLILGLKLLISNLKSIGGRTKIILFIVWVASLVALGVIGIRQATENAYNGEQITEQALPVAPGQTVHLAMQADAQYATSVYRHGGLKIKLNAANEKVIYSNDLRLIVRSTNDSVGKIAIVKKAEGNSFINAKKRAEAIDYDYTIEGNTLLLDGFFTTAFANKYRDQEIEITVYLPEGSILIADENTRSFHLNTSYYRDILDSYDEGKQLLILKNGTRCLNCKTGTDSVLIKTNAANGWKEEVSKSFENGETTSRTVENTFVKEGDTLTVIVKTDTIN